MNFKSFSFPLHRWYITVRSRDPYYLSIIKANLSYYGPSRRNQKQIPITLEFTRDSHTPKGLFSSSIYNMSHLGIYRAIDYQSNRIFIHVKRKNKIPRSWAYHYCFIRPLYLLLRKFDAVFIHASLVAKKGNGILIMGEPRAGKSTLALSFIQAGYDYFCDEHPILTRQKGRVIGKSFINRIAIPAVSRKNFPEIQKSLRWESYFKKYFFAPKDGKSISFGSSAKISAVIFPEFHSKDKLVVRKLDSMKFFLRLCQDDYFIVDRRTAKERLLSLKHLHFFEQLSKSARGYTLQYGKRQIPLISKITGGRSVSAKNRTA